MFAVNIFKAVSKSRTKSDNIEYKGIVILEFDRVVIQDNWCPQYKEDASVIFTRT